MWVATDTRPGYHFFLRHDTLILVYLALPVIKPTITDTGTTQCGTLGLMGLFFSMCPQFHLA